MTAVVLADIAADYPTTVLMNLPAACASPL
jgi:hypothetical protein